MSKVTAISDRLLDRLVPKGRASAATVLDTFTQFCGCYGGLRKVIYTRECTRTNGRVTCGPCTTANTPC